MIKIILLVLFGLGATGGVYVLLAKTDTLVYAGQKGVQLQLANHEYRKQSWTNGHRGLKQGSKDRGPRIEKAPEMNAVTGGQALALSSGVLLLVGESVRRRKARQEGIRLTA